jgi:hypothetical protein
MQLGFDTIGNATLIGYDRRPVLATDPWIAGAPYFGSWGMSHEVPREQMEAIRGADYVWFSHGHPDHLNAESLALLRDRRILLPAHVGGRIRQDLEGQGCNVRELPVARWVTLSERIRVMCLPDYNQDAVLLVEAGDALIVNANDASALGWKPLIRRIARGYRRSFLLALTGFGDADMINFFDESGKRITPRAMQRKKAGRPLGPAVARLAESYGVTHFVPFSSMHRYQREDSFWGNECRTPIEAHAEGFQSKRCAILPAFVRYDLAADRPQRIDPPAVAEVVLPAKEFGDDWSEDLDAEGVALAQRYFGSIEALPKFLDYVNLRVGGRDHVIPLAKRKFNRGVTFEAPRHSLVTALQYEIFDDLLIGNFMKTTLHGEWPASRLYPNFTPYVAKYADNGRARTAGELNAYFAEYRRRTGSFAFLRHRFATRATQVLRSTIEFDSTAWRVARRAYGLLRFQYR